jgi:hypothetical protein
MQLEFIEVQLTFRLIVDSGIIGEIIDHFQLYLSLLDSNPNLIELSVSSTSTSLQGKENYASLTSGRQNSIINITERSSSRVIRIKTLPLSRTFLEHSTARSTLIHQFRKSIFIYLSKWSSSFSLWLLSLYIPSSTAISSLRYHSASCDRFWGNSHIPLIRPSLDVVQPRIRVNAQVWLLHYRYFSKISFSQSSSSTDFTVWQIRWNIIRRSNAYAAH